MQILPAKARFQRWTPWPVSGIIVFGRRSDPFTGMNTIIAHPLSILVRLFAARMLKILHFCYRQYNVLSNGTCETIAKTQGSEEPEENMSLVKECPLDAEDHKKCNLSGLSLFRCHKIWLEVEGGRGKVRSLPVNVLPFDYGEFQRFPAAF